MPRVEAAALRWVDGGAVGGRRHHLPIVAMRRLQPNGAAISAWAEVFSTIGGDVRTLGLAACLAWSGACQTPDATDEGEVSVEVSADASVRRLPSDVAFGVVAEAFGLPNTPAVAFVMEKGFEPQVYLPRGALVPDRRVGGFTGQVAGQAVSAMVVENMQRSAAEWAPFVLAEPETLACEESALDEVCARTTVTQLATTLWRRQLSEADLASLETLMDTLLGVQGPREALLSATEALLQSPGFHYLAEPGDEGALLTGEQLASRLALVLWRGAPDAWLRGVAASGGLDTTDGVRSTVEAMLASPRAREALVRFHEEWLDIREVEQIRPDPSVFDADFDPKKELAFSAELQRIQGALLLEAQLLIEHELFDGSGTLTGLMTTPETFTSEITAGLNGVGPDQATGIRQEDWDIYVLDVDLHETWTLQHAVADPTRRSGVLTLPALLASQAHAVHPAPVLRGKLLFERVLCGELGPPPAVAEASAPRQDPEAKLTNRQRLEAATADASCQSCHQYMDPLGLAFESYDALGGWRETDFGQPIDTRGTYNLGETTLTFDGAASLTRQLADLEAVQSCYVDQWARYALGRPPLEEERADVADITARFIANGTDIKAMLVDLMSSDVMRRRRGGF